MCTRSEHGLRPAMQSFLVCTMEFCRAGSESVKISPYLIQRDQAVVSVESRIFQSLRHHRAGELLEFHGETRNRVPVRGILSFRDAGQKHPAKKIEDAGVSSRTSPLGSRDGVADVL